MEEKFKEIIAGFIKIPVQEIGPATPIDRSAVKNSIMLHRMYARLADEGLAVGNYTGIRVYGDLLRQKTTGDGLEERAANGRQPEEQEGGGHQPKLRAANVHMETAREPGFSPAVPGYPDGAVGIDIEEIAALPRTVDFRKEGFYKLNFSAREIAYCILQPDPYASVRDRPFHLLEIGHTTDGKPLAPGFSLSISHASGMAIALAVRGGGLTFPPAALPVAQASQAASGGAKGGTVSWLSWIALLVSVTALLIALLRQVNK
jgi:hypothetical protein